VKPRQEISEGLRWLAVLQAGVVSREQALGHGLSRHVLRRLVDTGAWLPVTRGLFATTAAPPSWEGLAWGGLLVGGERARLGPQASGYLHELVPEPPDPIDILVPATRVVRAAGPWQFHRETPGARSPRTVGAPARLTVEDTVLDLCAVGPERDVVSLVTSAVSARRTTAARLLRELRQRSRHSRRRLLRDILGDVAHGAESPIELRYLNDVERPHELPKGDRQQSRLGLPYCSDVGYDAWELLVELDGRAGHDGVGRFRDMRRDNRFAARDWLTLRYGWFDVVNRPCVVAFEVASVLVRRGWTGLPSRCPRCVNALDSDLVA
jgi:hypothetical protein